MPITENVFTADEFKGAIDANPDLLNVVKGTLTERKFAVRDETEETEFLTNRDAATIAVKTKEFATNIEKDIFETTGIAKLSQDEKYYEYAKRAITSSIKKLDDELKTIKEKGGNTSEADKARIATLEAAIGEKEKALQEGLAAKDGEINKIKANSELNSVFSGIKFKATLPESVVKMIKANVVSEILPQIRFQEDGAATIVDNKGEVLLNKQTYKPVTIEDYVKEKIADSIDTGKKAEGAGSKKEDEEGSKGDKFTTLPPTVKTKTQLTDYLLKLGYTDDSEDFLKIFSEHGKDLPLR